MKKILNYGSLNIDIVYDVDHFVMAGETISASNVTLFPGGKGMNQSVALAKAGANVYHGGKVGNDGKWLVDLMAEYGVKTQYTRQVDGQTGTAVIQVNRQGNNCILLNGGTNGQQTMEDLETTLANFGVGDWLLLQNEVNLLPQLVDLAYAKGMVIALNPSPMDEKIHQVNLEKISYFILNEIEGQALTHETDPEKICDKLLEDYPQAKIVLTLGEHGSLYGQENLRLNQPCFPAKAVDTTAAGDTFTGYFLALTMEGTAPQLALEVASKAAAMAVEQKGAAVSIPIRKDLSIAPV